MGMGNWTIWITEYTWKKPYGGKWSHLFQGGMLQEADSSRGERVSDFSAKLV